MGGVVGNFAESLRLLWPEMRVSIFWIYIENFPISFNIYIKKLFFSHSFPLFVEGFRYNGIYNVTEQIYWIKRESVICSQESAWIRERTWQEQRSCKLIRQTVRADNVICLRSCIFVGFILRLYIFILLLLFICLSIFITILVLWETKLIIINNKIKTKRRNHRKETKLQKSRKK